MNKKCGLLLDERYFNHRIEQSSLESPRRMQPLYVSVQDSFGNEFRHISPREASLKDITAVHSSFYLDQLWDHSTKDDPYSYDKDTYLMEDSIVTAQLAAGGCLELADNIMCGELESGFALIRPPGHHAEPGRGMGFCIINNIAVTAKYIQEKYGVKRILIVDYDVHHANGTQEIFYESDEVLVLSLHQEGLFPFTGQPSQVGQEKGEGYTINIPVHAQFGDLEYTFLLGRLLQSLTEQFLPEIILVSAGFDGHRDDNISSILLTTQWYKTAAAMLRQYAHDVCDGRILFILEGGYNPLSLRDSVLATMDSLLTSQQSRIGVLYAERAQALLTDHPLNKYWTLV